MGQPVPGTGDEYLPGTAPIVGAPVPPGTADPHDPRIPDIGRPDPVAPVPGEPAAPVDEQARLAAEWESLSSVHKFFNEPKLDYHVQVRGALLGAFGAAADGEAVALERVLVYYRALVKTSFQGFGIWVHAELAGRLRLAKLALGASFHLESCYGASIRFNANNASVLSYHSYGSAIDINGATSPNVKRLGPGSARAALIEAITNVDPPRTPREDA